MRVRHLKLRASSSVGHIGHDEQAKFSLSATSDRTPWPLTIGHCDSMLFLDAKALAKLRKFLHPRRGQGEGGGDGGNTTIKEGR